MLKKANLFFHPTVWTKTDTGSVERATEDFTLIPILIARGLPQSDQLEDEWSGKELLQSILRYPSVLPPPKNAGPSPTTVVEALKKTRRIEGIVRAENILVGNPHRFSWTATIAVLKVRLFGREKTPLLEFELVRT